MGIAFLNLLPSKAVVFPLSGINTQTVLEYRLSCNPQLH